MSGADHVCTGLRKLYAPPEWVFFAEVRSTTGSIGGPRYADGIAVNLYPSRGEWVLHGIEIKVPRVEPETSTQLGAPMVPIGRTLSRRDLALACGHVVPRPLAKTLPPTLPCVACVEGRPSEREIVEVASEDASEEDLHAFEVLIERRHRAAI